MTIENGRYNARALSGVFGVSARKQTEYVKVAFEVISGPMQGYQIAWDGYFTEKTSERTLESLRYCGCTFPDNDITNLDGLGANDVQIVIEHEESKDANGDVEFDEEGNPRTRPRVKWVNGQVGGIKAEHQLGDAAKRTLAQRMKASVAQARQGGTGGGRAPAPAGRQPSNQNRAGVQPQRHQSNPDDYNGGRGDADETLPF